MHSIDRLFSLGYNLSQLKEMEQVKKVFLEEIHTIFPPATFQWLDEKPAQTVYVEEVSTPTSRFGFIRIEHAKSLSKEIRITIKHSVQMLAVVLEKLSLEERLKSEKKRMQLIAEQRFQELTLEVEKRTASETMYRESEERYRELIDGMNETVWVIAYDGQLIDMNRTAVETLGYTREELLEIGLGGIDASIDLSEIQSLVNSMPDEKLQMFETSHRKKNGEVIPVEIYSSLVTYQGQDAILSIARNISERKRSEFALREKERQHHSMVSNLPGFVYRCRYDKDWTMLYLSEGCYRLTGYHPEDLIDNQNLTFNDIIVPDYQRDVYREWEEAIKNKVSFEREYEIITADRARKWVLERGFGVYDEAGELLFLEGYIEDVSIRKKDELIHNIMNHILSESMIPQPLGDLIEIIHHELEKVFDASCFQIVLYREEREVIDRIGCSCFQRPGGEKNIDDEFCRLVIGERKTQLLDHKTIARVFSEKEDRYGDVLVKCWLGVPLFEREIVAGVLFVRSYEDSHAFDLQSARLLEMVAHELSNVIQRSRMIEDLIKSKERAEESDQLKSAFLANISHEIRTPLNAIMGFSSLLTEEDSADLIAHYANIIESNSEQLLSLIDSIVIYSKLQTKMYDLQPSLFPVEKIMRDVQNTFSLQMYSENNTFLFDAHFTGADLIYTDYEKLKQVLNNLISNAVKYSKQSEIRIGCKKVRDGWQFSIKDQGIGISEEDKERIFDRFYRGKNISASGSRGTGLGLSIVKELVDMMGGKIWVESQPGEGSVFYVIIPDDWPDQTPGYLV